MDMHLDQVFVDRFHGSAGGQAEGKVRIFPQGLCDDLGGQPGGVVCCWHDNYFHTPGIKADWEWFEQIFSRGVGGRGVLIRAGRGWHLRSQEVIR